MGQSHLMGINYTREGTGAREYIHYSDKRLGCVPFNYGGHKRDKNRMLT